MHRGSTAVMPSAWTILAALSFALALLAALIAVLHESSAVHTADRTYPGDTAPCDTALQACIDGAAVADTIHIAAGTYVTDELVIDKALHLVGAGSGATTLQALGSQRGCIDSAESAPTIRCQFLPQP